MKEQSILDLAKIATKEEEKPIRNIVVKYDPVKQQVSAKVTLAPFIGNRVYEIYDINNINYFLECLSVQEGLSIEEILNNQKKSKWSRLVLSDKLKEERKLPIRTFDGKRVSISFDPNTGKILMPTIKKTVTKSKSTPKVDETAVVDTPEVEVVEETTEEKKTIREKLKEKITKRKETVEEKDGSKSRSKLIKITAVAVAAIVGLAALDYILSGGSKEAAKNNSGKNKTRTEDDYDGNTYTESDEEIIVGLQQGDYAWLGSANSMVDMNTQIDTITELATTKHPSPQYFETYVVSSDSPAIAVISNMRNSVLAGQCDLQDFLTNIVHYVCEDSTIFNYNSIKGFRELSPYARFIVVRMAQGMLQFDPNYSHTSRQYYDVYSLGATFRALEDPLVRELLQVDQKTR